MASSLDLVNNVLMVVSVLNYFSGVPACLRMWRTGRTDGWPFLFFVIGLVGGVGMIDYGRLTDNFTITFLNSLLVLLNCFYIISYLILIRYKGRSLVTLMGGAVALGSIYAFSYYNQLALDEKIALLGSVSAAVFFFMNCVTIFDVIEVSRTQKAEFDLLMLSVGMLNCSLWLIYGIILQDVYLYVPTIPFLITGCMKIVQMRMYRQPVKPSKKKE